MEKTEPTYQISIYASGPIEIAKQVIREECFHEGLCVAITPTTFIYTGGEEEGFVIGLINYPRFPSTTDKIMECAVKLAKKILDATFQTSTLIIEQNKTIWISKRED